MTVIRINVIEVPPGSGDELALRFARRAGAVDGAAGIRGLRPAAADRRTPEHWLVVTRWQDEESFRAWTAIARVRPGHRGASDPGPGDRPVATHSELWSFDLVDLGAQP